MDKNVIKKYAVWARRELIMRVAGRAAKYGITEDDCGDIHADSVDGRVFSSTEKEQRKAFIEKVRAEGYEQAVEEVAYTWFNRFCALRYMEVNGYLPTHIRVFTNEEGEFKPHILDEAIHLELAGLDMEKVFSLKGANETEELYRYLLVTQCNALSWILPGMFQKIADYTELLLPDNLLRKDSVIERMIAEIPEEDWTDQVQIIGWLYQYYNAEKKDEVFAALKKNVKITKENIPAATQLFTPDWIVRYMVENSLGRLWVEGHPNEELKSGWKYYLEEAEQEPEVEAQLVESRKEYATLKPEDIKCIDPCCGSGHILAYMFDVLMQIYESYGYTTQEAVGCIIENNLYGLDIDERAAQLAYFAVMMKARSYDRRFFNRDIQPHVYAIQESNVLDQRLIDYFIGNNFKLKKDFETVVNELHDAKEYGAILNISKVDFESLYFRVEEVKSDINFHVFGVMNLIFPLLLVAQTLSRKYDVIVTNPPYMGNRGMSAKLNQFVQNNFPNSKSDMFAVFIERCRDFSKNNGFYGMITQPSFMFLTVFENLRKRIIEDQKIISLLHMGRGIFGIDFGSAAFVICNASSPAYISSYMKLHQRTFQYIDPGDIARLFMASKDDHNFSFNFLTYKPSDNIEVLESEEKEVFEENPAVEEQKIFYDISQKSFLIIPGMPIAYWLSKAFINVFQNKKLGEYAEVITGITTGNNNEFLRLWYEVSRKRIAFGRKSMDEINTALTPWIPYSKGGDRRNFYGNGDYVVNWARKDEFNRSKTTLKQFYLQEAITWPFISSGKFSARFLPYGYLWDVAGSPCFFKNDIQLKYTLGFLTTKVADRALKIMNPTINVQAIDLAKLPLIYEPEYIDQIVLLVNESIDLSVKEWNEYELSWDFCRHPLCLSTKEKRERMDFYATKDNINEFSRLAMCYERWKEDSNFRFDQLKKNEEKLNRIFISIYGLQDELAAEVDDKDITMRKADLQRDIKSLLSYAVGCMFGRYSLDIDGVVYAGDEWKISNYDTYKPNSSGILPICDDEYFTDDIVNFFIDFIRVTYGEDTLEENLQFIADALGGSGSSREVIRKYFLNDFYKDHCKIYQKRPIYWLFDSGKKNGFKCLVYLHRYRPDTIAKVRTEYIHEQQARYRTAIADLQSQMDKAATSERIKLSKELKKLQEQADELLVYEEKIHHLADQFIDINLDDGVKVNYAKFQDVLAKIK